MAIEAWLSLLQAAQQITTQSWLDALKRCGSAEALVAAPRRTLLDKGLAPDAVAALDKPDRDTEARWRAWLAAPNRKLVTFGSREYPQRLAEIPDAPLALWVEGARLDMLFGPQLAIVGSRSPTADGRETAVEFARYLAQRGLTITSGLATGIDGASHRGAVAAVGGTIAVLGGGLDVIFPREHSQLAAEIAARGLLVSEYAPGVQPQKLFFPQRNRIIAGLSLGTLVVEATRRSGSLITAKLALDYGREVFAIPGSIHNPLARGCHQLLRQGAKLVETGDDIFAELRALVGALAPALQAAVSDERKSVTAGPESPAAAAPVLDKAYEILLDALGFEPAGVDTLVERTGFAADEVASMLLILELDGELESRPGGRYVRRVLKAAK